MGNETVYWDGLSSVLALVKIVVASQHKKDNEKQLDLCQHLLTIGLITVFDAILTGRQSGQKLQCLYGNPIANNFFQN